MATPEGPAGDEGGTGRPAGPAPAGGIPSHDVFVSYSVSDKPVADAIVARLEQVGIRCWVAPRDVIPGQVWGQAILSAIETSRLMVVVLSGAANESRQVIREVERAVANDVVVVPFRIDAVEPTGAMAYFLASEHWLDAMSPPMEAHVGQLVSVAQALLERMARPEATAQPVRPAPVEPLAPAAPVEPLAPAAPVEPLAPAAPVEPLAPIVQPVPTAPSMPVTPPAPPFAPPAPPVMQQVPPAQRPAPAQQPAPPTWQPASPAMQPRPATAPGGQPGGPGRVVAAAAAVVVIALVAVGGAWAAHLGPFTSTPATTPTPLAFATPTPSTPSATPSPSILPTPSATTATTPSPGATTLYGAEADVHALRQVVPLDVAPGCVSLELLDQETAALSCTATDTQYVWYERFASAADLESGWATLLAAKGVTAKSGGCTTESGGEGGWDFKATPGVEQGRVACFGSAGSKPTFVWTDATALLRTWIVGTSGATLASLRERWLSGNLDPSRDVAALVMGSDAKTALVPADLVDSCTRVEATGTQRAAVSCRSADGTTVIYTSYASQADVDTDWAIARTAAGLEKDGGGKCGQGVPGETTWDLQSDPTGTARGRVLCQDSGGRAVLAWSDYATSTRVRLEGSTIDALYALWVGGTLDPVAK